MALTPAQQLAVSTIDQCCLIVSIPGSGKTTVAAQKIAHILNSSPNNQVVAISFSRESANELRERALKVTSPEHANRITTGTFHSLALRHLIKHSKEDGKSPPRIISGAEQKQYVKRALDHILYETGSDEKHNLDDVAQAVDGARSKFYRDEVPEFVLMVLEEYERLLNSNNVADFAGIMYDVTKMIAAETLPCLEGTHILVDEAQDIDEVQWVFSVLHMQLGRMVLDMICDDDQSIYRFRNAMGYQGMMDFHKKCNARLINLDLNFRCKSEILDVAAQMIAHNKKRIQKRLVAAKGPGGSVTYMQFNSRTEELKGVEDLAKTFLKKPGNKNRTIAVLARTNKLLEDLQSELTASETPYKRINVDSIWGEDPVCFYVSAIKSLSGKGESLSGIEQLLYWAGLGHTEGKRLMAEYEGRLIDILRQGERTPRGLSEKSVRVIRALRERLPKWRAWLNSGDNRRISRCLEGIATWMVEYAPSKSNANASERYRAWCEGALNRAAKVLCALKGRVSDRLMLIQQLDKTDNKDDSGVILVSMHSSKGLEYDCVIVMGLEQCITPGIDVSEEVVEEERRLVYVAVTRARDELIVTNSRTRQIGKNSVKSEPSQFLREVKSLTGEVAEHTSTGFGGRLIGA